MRNRFALLFTIITFTFVLSAGVFFGFRWLENPLKIASEISGIELPGKAEVVHYEDRIVKFFHEGDRATVIKLPQEFFASIDEDCSLPEYKFARYSDENVVYPYLNEFFDIDGIYCYKYVSKSDSRELSLLYSGNLIVYEYYY